MMTRDQPHVRAIAFDFDGTLVDSAPGILRGMKLALDKNALQPCTALDPSIIGPPLKQTLARISGTSDEELLAHLVNDFKHCYDTRGYRDTLPYPSIGEALATLHDQGHLLYLATNKRGIPTRLILDHLGWTHFFRGVYCLDEHPECPDKGTLLAKLLVSHALSPQQTPYVGDTPGDAQAAISNGMPYLHVAWGYGTDHPAHDQHIHQPEQLVATLLELANKPWN